MAEVYKTANVRKGNGCVAQRKKGRNALSKPGESRILVLVQEDSSWAGSLSPHFGLVGRGEIILTIILSSSKVAHRLPIHLAMYLWHHSRSNPCICSPLCNAAVVAKWKMHILCKTQSVLLALLLLR